MSWLSRIVGRLRGRTGDLRQNPGVRAAALEQLITALRTITISKSDGQYVVTYLYNPPSRLTEEQIVAVFDLLRDTLAKRGVNMTVDHATRRVTLTWGKRNPDTTIPTSL